MTQAVAQTKDKPVQDVSHEDGMRAEWYSLLAVLLAHPPTQDIIDLAASLEGDETEIGQGVRALARLAASMNAKAVEREFNALFIGLGRGELLPYASFYLTGFLNEKPLATLRGHMAKLGIARNPDIKDPEDHIASLCEMMAGLIRGEFGERYSVGDQEAFFNSHLATWAGHFFEDLEGAEGSVFYAPIGKIGRAFMEIEIEAFRMASDDG